MHFSSVDLPEPFSPMTPKTSPSLDAERHVSQSGELVEASSAPRRDQLLDRVRLLAMQTKVLGEVVDLEGEISHGSHLLGEARRELVEDPGTEHERPECNDDQVRPTDPQPGKRRSYMMLCAAMMKLPVGL